KVEKPPRPATPVFPPWRSVPAQPPPSGSGRARGEPIAPGAEPMAIVATPEGLQAAQQPVDGRVERSIGRPVGRQPARKPIGQRAPAQLDRVAEMAPGQGRVPELLQRDLAERDMDP